MTLDTSGSAVPRLDAKMQLTHLQRFLTLPRETIPRLTGQEAGRFLRGAAERLGLEFIEIAEVVPSFLLLPRTGQPRVLLFQTWHAEAAPVEPAAVEGAERLALGIGVAGIEAAAEGLVPEAAGSFGLVVTPAATAGSRGLDGLLRENRARLAASAAYWLRVAPPRSTEERAQRRRVFLGARGRVVIGLRGGDANPYRVRDAIVEELREQAYGPRPLDFELIRKLAQSPEALDLVGGTEGSAEDRIRRVLFDPRGEVMTPPVAHPDRPRAWLTFQIAEGTEPDSLAARVQELAGEGSEMVERYPWDRANIHHPAVHALIEESKSRSAGAEIWPMSPWPTPSGLFSRALGIGLAEWGIPLSRGGMVRFPKPDEFESMAVEAASVLRRALAQAT